MASKSKKSKKSIDSVISQKDLRQGLSIYKTGRSPYWYIRLRDPLLGKYVVRSSKETSRVEAREAAFEFAASYQSNANSEFARSKATSFEHHAKMLNGGGTVLDAFCGCGGNTIHLAGVFETVRILLHS